MKKMMLIYCFLILTLLCYGQNDLHKLVYISINTINNNNSIPFDIYNDPYFESIFQTLKDIVEKNEDYHNFSINSGNFFLNYYNDDGLAVSTGYMIKKNKRVNKALLAHRSDIFESLKDRNDFNLQYKLGEVMSLSKLKKNIPLKDKKVIIKKLDPNFFAIWSQYQDVQIEYLFQRVRE